MLRIGRRGKEANPSGRLGPLWAVDRLARQDAFGRLELLWGKACMEISRQRQATGAACSVEWGDVGGGWWKGSRQQGRRPLARG